MAHLIGVSGGSGSGKTTFVRRLKAYLGADRCSVISADSYYKDLSHLSPAERAQVNFDHPASLDLDLLTEHLQALRCGSEIAVPVYDFAEHTRSAELELINPTVFAVVEGILLFSKKAIREQLDTLIYKECPEDIRFERRLRRDAIERGRTETSIRQQWQVTVEPMYLEFVAPFASYADLVSKHGSSLDDAVAEAAQLIENHERIQARTLGII